MVEANEAERIGLVSRVVPGDRLAEEGGALAARLAAMPTLALGATKRLLREALTEDLETALDAEAAMQNEMVTTEDHVEGVMASGEKREPRFRGR